MISNEKFRIVFIAIFIFAIFLCLSYYLYSAKLVITIDTKKTYSTLQCSNTIGTTKNFNISDKHRELHRIHAHTFQFPAPLNNAYLCVPSKNGNKNWGALFYKLWFNKVPPNGEIVTNSMHSFQRQIFPEPDVHMWMVSRSPYVRILSTYIEKIECINECNHQYLEGFHHFKNDGNITFDTFVTKLYDLVVRNRDVTKLKPIQRAAELCHIDHHFCIQSACLFKLPDNKVRVLKLEDQGSWYKNFTSCLNIKSTIIQGNEWIPYSGKPCYYTPTTSCDDSLKEQSQSSLLVDPIHGKGAVNKLKQYYTKNSIEKISYLYEYDLAMLDYSVWDGNTPL